MSYRVLVIPEDPTQNGYILKPLVEAMLDNCGKPRAKVTILSNPRVQGYEDAKQALEKSIFEAYTHMHLLLFLPDADGNDRAKEFGILESTAATAGVKLLCCAAVQEVEVWLLAGHLRKIGTSIADVRSDVSVKENLFEPFLEEHGDARRPGGGRDLLMAETLKKYRGLIQRCPELKELEDRIRPILAQSAD